MIRVVLPQHLRTLVKVSQPLELQLAEPATIGAPLDALENRYPVLRGTIRDQLTRQRRPFIRFFACGQDLSLEPLETALPPAVTAGVEPVRIVGAMPGG